jgi:class 3 adenylate cyclase
VAYQVLGDGDRDLLWFWGMGNLDVQWLHPPLARAFRRLSSFGRLILFDRRGTGLSDPVPRDHLPTWEEWAEDVTAVLDAADCDEVAIWGTGDAGPMAVLFAALHPERVTALILENTTARHLIDDDYPIGASVDEVDRVVRGLGAIWGTDLFAQIAFPALAAADDHFVRWSAMFTRATATPLSAEAQYRYLLREMDVRPALPLVQAPTLVRHHPDSPLHPIDHGRYLADRITGAVFVELDGLRDPTPSDDAIDSALEWLTGEPAAPEPERVLATVLFTDIVGSTKVAVRLGDHRWRAVLDEHDQLVRAAVLRHRGHIVKTTGDGVLASFDGPGRAVRCAQEVLAGVGQLGIAVRAGLHAGECERRGDDLAGIAVHTAARVAALAGPGEVLVTRTVVDLVAGSELQFVDKGLRKLRGVPGSWQLLAVAPFS